MRRMYGDHVVDVDLQVREEKGQPVDATFVVYGPDNTMVHYRIDWEGGFPSEYQAMKFVSRWVYEMIQGRPTSDKIVRVSSE